MSNTRNIYDPAARSASDEERLALADAIYADLGLGWKPYPENRPPNESKDYFVVVLSADKTTVFYAHWSKIKSAWLSPFGGLMEEWHDKVIAYMEIPPYQPED